MRQIEREFKMSILEKVALGLMCLLAGAGFFKAGSVVLQAL